MGEVVKKDVIEIWELDITVFSRAGLQKDPKNRNKQNYIDPLYFSSNIQYEGGTKFVWNYLLAKKYSKSKPLLWERTTKVSDKCIPACWAFLMKMKNAIFFNFLQLYLKISQNTSTWQIGFCIQVSVVFFSSRFWAVIMTNDKYTWINLQGPIGVWKEKVEVCLTWYVCRAPSNWPSVLNQPYWAVKHPPTSTKCQYWGQMSNPRKWNSSPKSIVWIESWSSGESV